MPALRLIASAAVAVAFTACGKAKSISAKMVDPVTPLEIQYTLRQGHDILGEFHRDLHIVFAHRDVDFPLEYDSGGFVLMSIYKMPDGRLVLFDRNDYVVVDPTQEKVRAVEGVEDLSGAQFVGCFDWFGERNELQFVPPSKQPDRYGPLKK